MTKPRAYEHEVESGNGWTRWVQPIRRGYLMACCDCALVHTLDFRVYRGRAQFRAKRNHVATRALRKRERIMVRARP